MSDLTNQQWAVHARDRELDPDHRMGVREWRQMIEDCLDDLDEVGVNGLSGNQIRNFVRHWQDQVGDA